MDRRDWLRSAALAGAAVATHPNITLGAPAVHTRRPYAPDLVLRGGTVVDGTGGAPRLADVAITGDRVTAMGRVSEAGAVELDVSGLAVSPGFIDIHSHAEMSLLVEPRAESRIRQGVTLEVIGQDGTSIGPVSIDAAQRRAESNRRDFGIEADFSDLSGFFNAIDAAVPAVSVASMVGHGTVRGHVVGAADRPATGSEIQQMRVLIREALSQGAVGLSSGLEYTPGSFASTEELVEVHRNYWKAEAALRSIEAAALSGVDVHFDRYPYVAYATGLTNLFPTWARADGTAAFLRRLEDPESSGRLEQYARDKIALLGSWDSIQITFTPTDRNVEVRGRRLGEFAQQSGEEPYALVLRLLQEEQGNVGVVGFGMSEENTALILSHERAMVCSDGGAYAPYGPLSTGSPHPRGYGAFPRVLGLYVRERGDFSLASAVKKMSAMPARKLHLRDRGVLRVGGFADVAVFEPDIVADQATFASPHQYPLGIPHVIVNGVLTLRDGEHTGRRGGRAVRGPT